MRVDSIDVRKPVAALLIIACLTAAYFFIFHCFQHTSDEANPLLSAYEMTHGNPLLKGWIEPASTFYGVDLLLIGALTLVLGKSPIVLVLAPSIIWAVAVWAASTVAASYCRPERKTVAVLTVVVVLGLPAVFANFPITAITTAPVHIGSMVYTLGLFVLASKYLSTESTPRWTVPLFIAVLALLSMGDPFSPFFCAFPICLACVTLRVAPQKRAYKLLVATIVGMVAGKMLLMVISAAGGFNVLDLPGSFVQIDNLPTNASLFAQGILGLFGADFFGKGVDLSGGVARFVGGGPLVTIARLPFVALFCVAVWKIGQRVTRVTLSSQGSVDPMRALLFWSVAIVLAANLFSTLPINIITSRYLLPVLILGSILIAIEIPQTGIAKTFLISALIVSAASIVGGYRASDDRHRFSWNEQQQLTAWLRANDLTQGYGQYWSAGIVTVLSGGKTTVNAVQPSPDGRLIPMIIISSDEWLRKPPASKYIFVVVDNREIVKPVITQANVVGTFGNPESVHQVGPYTVSIYESGTANVKHLLPQG